MVGGLAVEDFEYKGTWWLSTNPDEKIGGVLTFSVVEGLRLDLLGSFGDEVPFFQLGSLRYSVVLGVATNGDLVTLYNVRSSNFRYAARAEAFSSLTRSYSAQICLIGAH